MLVCVRLHHVAATNWGTILYMNMDHLLEEQIFGKLYQYKVKMPLPQKCQKVV